MMNLNKIKNLVTYRTEINQKQFDIQQKINYENMKQNAVVQQNAVGQQNAVVQQNSIVQKNNIIQQNTIVQQIF